jgi:hypothetical protein
VAIVVVAAVVAALPWLWANVRSGFMSLRPSALSGQSTPAGQDFATRLSTFFHHSVPMLFNLLQPLSGVSLFGTRLGELLHYVLLLLLVVALALGVMRGGRALAIVVGVAAFPFLYAFQPGTWYWQDGRYAVYLAPLLVLAVAMGCDEAVARLGRRRVARHGRPPVRTVAAPYIMIGVLAASGALSIVAFHQSAHDIAPRAEGAFAPWGDPESPTHRAIAGLEAKGVTTGYADYWVAYDLDLVSGEHLNVTPIANSRFASIARTVAHDRRAAWIFVPPAQLPTGYGQFAFTGDITGPDGMAEATFESRLQGRHVAYRVVDVGLLQAVVPARPVTPSQVGLDPAGP